MGDNDRFSRHIDPDKFRRNYDRIFGERKPRDFQKGRRAIIVGDTEYVIKAGEQKTPVPEGAVQHDSGTLRTSSLGVMPSPENVVMWNRHFARKGINGEIDPKTGEAIFRGGPGVARRNARKAARDRGLDI